MSSKKRDNTAKALKTIYCCSHIPFSGLIQFSVRASSNPVLKTGLPHDHVAQICGLVEADNDKFFWSGVEGSESRNAHEILLKLEHRVFRRHDLQAAETIYAIASRAAFHVLALYVRERELFDQIARRRRTLPCLFSIHPCTAGVVRQMISDSRLGTETDAAGLIGSKAHFVSDNAPNIYARTIIESVKMNRKLASLGCHQTGVREFDRKGAEELGLRILVLPFPKCMKGIEEIPVPITPENVVEYWRKGKEIILEEMPDFHERPEWKNYREKRHYDTGAKKGAIQHAIFKDILASLKTIAGANKRKTSRKAVAHDLPK